MDTASHQLITYLELFCPLTNGDKTLIIDTFKAQSFREGEYLFYPHHACKELFFVCEGVLRIVVQNEKGNEVTYFFLKKNQFCTILNSFNSQAASAEGIQAACDVKVLSVSRVKLFSLYEKLPHLKVLIDQIMQQALLDKIALRNSYLGLDAAARYKLLSCNRLM